MAQPAPGAALEVRVLGPLQVVVDGTPVEIPGARQRTLLALLVLHANEHVSRDRVVEELWNGSPPQAAQASLRVAVSKLRRLLGESRDRLETVAGGYRLRLEPMELDSNRFEALLNRAREEQDAARALELLDQALGLCSGPPLADLRYESSAQSESRRLSELLLTAREERIDAKLTLGRHEESIPELEALVEENPLRERLRGQLMLALYRSGRQAEALEVYRGGRRLLLDELGLEPVENLRRLEQAILTQDPALAAPAPVAPHRTRPRTRKRRRAPLAAVALAAVAAAGLAAWLGVGDSPSAAQQAQAIAVVDARTNRLARFALGWRPERLVLDSHTLWLANGRDLTIARFDLTGHRIEQTIGVGVSTATLTAGAGAVWVLSDRHELIRVDPAFGVLKARKLPLGDGPDNSVGDPAGLAVGAGSVWVENGGRTLLRIAPRTSGVQRRLDLGQSIDAVAYGNGSVWVTGGEPDTLLRIDPRTNAVTARIPIAERGGAQAPYPIGLSVGAGAVWVLNGNTGTVTRVDPALNAVTATTPRLSVDPIRITAGAGAVWVADAANDTVIRIDPATGRIVRVIPVGGRPVGLAAGDRKVWISVDAA